MYIQVMTMIQKPHLYIQIIAQILQIAVIGHWSIETNGLYFYNNLDYKINTSWHDELHNNYVKTPHSPTCVMIYGEYKFIPIKMFNNIDSLIKIGMYHWNRLNKQYLKLKTGLTDKNKEFVEHIKLKNKCKIVNKRMNDFKRDFL